MESPGGQQDGVLVISAWVDPEAAQFRARILQTVDPTASTHDLRWASSPEDVLDIVRDWLAILTV